MPGILIKANRSSEDKDGSKQLPTRVRVPLIRASRLLDEEVMEYLDIIQIRNYLESLPTQERSLEFNLQSTDEESENDADSTLTATEEAQRIRQIEEDRKNHMNRFFR